MTLTQERKESLEKTYQYLFNHKLILKMKEIPMHRGSNCYLHTFKLAKAVIKKAVRSKKDFDLENLLVATILHDYYLYDWRIEKDKLKHHGKNHPLIAIENAKRDFAISEKSAEIISTHMWPINIFNPPKSKEARLLCNLDTWIALKEFLTSKRYKAKKEKDYIDNLSSLFDK